MSHNKTLDRSRDSRAKLAGCGFAPLYPAQTLRADWRLGQRSRYVPSVSSCVVPSVLIQLDGRLESTSLTRFARIAGWQNANRAERIVRMGCGLRWRF